MIIKAVIPDPESLDRECSVCAVSFVCKRHQTDNIGNQFKVYNR